MEREDRCGADIYVTLSFDCNDFPNLVMFCHQQHFCQIGNMVNRITTLLSLCASTFDNYCYSVSVNLVTALI